MPSFDIVSEYERHEAVNAVDQANRELSTRFDFRGSDANFTLKDDVVTMVGDSEFQLKQMLDILQSKLHKRGIDIACLDIGEPQASGRTVVQPVTLRQGIDTDLARKIVKLIKAQKIKVQAAIQGDKIRVSAKKRDDLQRAIAMLREQDLVLQQSCFDEYRANQSVQDKAWVAGKGHSLAKTHNAVLDALVYSRRASQKSVIHVVALLAKGTTIRREARLVANRFLTRCIHQSMLAGVLSLPLQFNNFRD